MSSRTLRAVVSDRDDESSVANSDDDIEDHVESLVSGRTKRVTAGNRLSSLLDKEADDELELLFAENEEEEDVEFEGDEDEDASDVQLDSSSDDDEDQGPTKASDELEGERELQRQDRAEKLRKRKAQDIFKRTGGLRKRIKVDPIATNATPTTPAAHPRKKSERVSWIHTPDEGPTRSSTRKQTVQNKVSVHLRMVESEKRRMQLIHVMEAAAKRKEASKPKVMTQAERMEEAARTERKNAKSLNRWEEMEKKRSEEQRAKLEALHNRKLSGPVITWWSGMAEWVDGMLGRVGTRRIKETNEGEDAKNHSPGNSHTPQGLEEHNLDAKGQNSPNILDNTYSSKPPKLHHSKSPRSGIEDPKQIQQLQGPNGFLDGIQYYASLPAEPQDHSTFPPNLVSNGSNESTSLSHPPRAWSSNQPPEPVSPFQPTIKPPAPTIEYSSRNLVVLENIDVNALKMPGIQSHTLLKKRNGKIPSKSILVSPAQFSSLIAQPEPTQELCAITAQPAKFRDPKTGLTYLNSYAYKEIQRLQNGGSRWSTLLGCYVGPTSSVARGVPERFWKKE